MSYDLFKLGLIVLYAAGMFALTVVAWRQKRSRDLTRAISALPEKDRLRALQKEVGTVVKPDDPDAYLRKREDRQFMVQIAVSLALLGAGLYVILSKNYGVDDAKWAYGIVGTVVGYWLKGK